MRKSTLLFIFLDNIFFFVKNLLTNKQDNKYHYRNGVRNYNLYNVIIQDICLFKLYTYIGNSHCVHKPYHQPLVFI